MPESLRCVPANALIAGYDFSTGGVKALAFDLAGNTVAAVRLPTDLWTDGGVSELNLMQLEGQALASTRALADALDGAHRLTDWLVAGISATHHTAGRIDEHNNQVRRAICWNDQTLAKYHAEGLAAARRARPGTGTHRRAVGRAVLALAPREGRTYSQAEPSGSAPRGWFRTVRSRPAT